MTSAADELRTAATALRSLTADATGGPWTADDPNTRWGDDHDHRIIGGGKILATYSNEHNGPLNAMYAAAMGPNVGAAIAQLLDHCAELHEANPPHRGQPRPGCQWCADEDFPCADMRKALAVARAINGGQP